MKPIGLAILDFLKIGIFALLIVIPIRMFVFQPFLVRGNSMAPNFHNGDYLIVDELSYRLRDPQRAEVVVFQFPRDPSQRYIKRIIGLPGETIQIKDREIRVQSSQEDFALDESRYVAPSVKTEGSFVFVLKEDEYLVLGDNRPFSSDSRAWGILPRENIIGKVWWRVLQGSILETFSEKLPSYSR